MVTDLTYKKIIAVMAVVFGAVTTAAVLATYFAKQPTVNNIRLLDYVCQNLSYIKGYNLII